MNSWHFSLRPGAGTSPAGGAGLVVGDGRTSVRFGDLGPAVCEALRSLAGSGVSGAALAELRSAGGAAVFARCWYALSQLARRRLLRVSVTDGSSPFATLLPAGTSLSTPPREAEFPGALRLSRFAYLHRTDEGMELESPCSESRLILHDPRAAAVVHALGGPLGPSERASLGRQLGLTGVEAVCGLLRTAGMVHGVGADGRFAEDADAGLGSWEFHDLLFHARSRLGRHDAPLGGTYHRAGKVDPPPPVRPPVGEPRPDGVMAAVDRRPDVAGDTMPFAEVVSRRRSVRVYGEPPITAGQLLAFLDRVGRVVERTAWHVPANGGTVRVDGTSRPYPAGGGLYELELYPIVNRCEGIPGGLYHYDPLGRRLCQIRTLTGDVAALVRDAASAAGMPPDAPQVVLTVTSRYPRLAWKYSSLAYALTLKHVGVLFELMYLTATSMRLAPCAVGSGDSDLFARASEIDYYSEPAVGEFLLGSRADASLPDE